MRFYAIPVFMLCIFCMSSNVFSATPSDTTNPAVAQSKWNFIKGSSDPKHDKSTVLLSLPANNTLDGGTIKSRPILKLQCKNGQTIVSIAFGMVSANNVKGEIGKTRLTIAFDTLNKKEVIWKQALSGKELIAPNPIGLIRMMLRYKRCVVGFTPYDEKVQ